jgi:hypothetical protein
MHQNMVDGDLRPSLQQPVATIGAPIIGLRNFVWPAAFLLSVALLLAPALWNGFPLIFADTGGYLARPFERTLAFGRSALYGTFIAAGIPFDFWPVVLAQAAAAVWVIVLTLRVQLAALRPSRLVIMMIGLAALTSLPWYAGQLMPDILVPLAVLSLHLLAFHTGDLRPTERIGLIGLVAFAIAAHMSILALTLALLLLFLLLRTPRRWHLPRPRLPLPLAAVGAGMALALLSNAIIAGQFAFTPGGGNFLFARLVQDDIVSRYLDDHCPDPALRLCEMRAQIPKTADDWLWGDGSPFYKLGGAEGFEAEARKITWETLRLYPALQIEAAVADTLEQAVTLRTGEGINPDNNWHAEWVLSQYAPASMPRFRAAAQQRGQFDFSTINDVQVPVALVAMALLPFLFRPTRGRERPVNALALTVFAALLVNAAVCAVFSNPNARYQSRIAPLATLTVMAAVLDRRRVRSPQLVPRHPGAAKPELPGWEAAPPAGGSLP